MTIKMNMLVFLMKTWGVIKSAQYRLRKFRIFIRIITLCLFYIPKLRTLVFWGFRNVISRIMRDITRVHIHYVLLPYVPYWYGRYVRESYVPIIIIIRSNRLYNSNINLYRKYSSFKIRN